MNYENKELCKKCGGMCCKKSGCDYFTSDFSVINKNSIIKALESGNISIVSTLDFDTLNNGTKVAIPFLYLRARNKDRDIVDLFSMKKQCSMLKEDGCFYSLEDRPGGGANLIPDSEMCKPLLDPVEEMLKWKPYQNLLAKLVKRFTGKSVDVVLRENVEETLYEILTEQFYGVSKIEIADIIGCINELAECLKEECDRARKRAKESKRLKKI